MDLFSLASFSSKGLGWQRDDRTLTYQFELIAETGIHATLRSKASLVTNTLSYKLNEPKVTAERLDGEFILLHFETGCYFSAVGTAADVCQLLFAGTATSEITEALVRHYELDRDVIQQRVDGFVAQLVGEDLIAVIESEMDSTPAALSFSGKFTELAFEKFDDMSEQLLLDPIHEIDDGGWPQAKPA